MEKDNEFLVEVFADENLNRPCGICFDDKGNLYTSDYDCHTIKRIDSRGNVFTVAGSNEKEEYGLVDAVGSSARFHRPCGICFDPKRDCLYVADLDNHSIRMVMLRDYSVTTICGSSKGCVDGRGNTARFESPYGICFDSKRSIIYVSEYGNHKVRMIDQKWMVKTLAGGSKGMANGIPLKAQFNSPFGICVDMENDYIYMTDFSNRRVRMIDPQRYVTTIAGSTDGDSDGGPETSQFHFPNGICFNPHDKCLYMTDYGNFKIKKIDPDFNVTTFIGSGEKGDAVGPRHQTQVSHPYGITVDSAGGYLYFADFDNHKIKRLKLKETKDFCLFKGLYSKRENGTFHLISGFPIHKFVAEARFPPHFDFTLCNSLNHLELEIVTKYLYLDIFDSPILSDMESLKSLFMKLDGWDMEHLRYLISCRIRTLGNPEDEIMEYLSVTLAEECIFSKYRHQVDLIMNQFAFTDTIIHVEDIYGDMKEYECHEEIISTNSEYFSSIFRYAQKGGVGNNTISHESLLPHSCFEVLFLYWYNKVPEELSLEQCIYLAVWGDMYLTHDFWTIQERCINTLSHSIDDIHERTNILDIISLFNTNMINDLMQIEIFQKLNDYELVPAPTIQTIN